MEKNKSSAHTTHACFENCKCDHPGNHQLRGGHGPRSIGTDRDHERSSALKCRASASLQSPLHAIFSTPGAACMTHMRSLAAGHRTTAGRPAEERRTTAAPSVESGSSRRLGSSLAMARSASTDPFLRARPSLPPQAPSSGPTPGLPPQAPSSGPTPLAAASCEVRGAPRAQRCQPLTAPVGRGRVLRGACCGPSSQPDPRYIYISKRHPSDGRQRPSPSPSP